MWWINYGLGDYALGSVNVHMRERNSLVFEYPCGSSRNCTYYKATLQPGTYRLECYGAGNANNTAGAYTSGILKLEAKKTFFFYLGTISYQPPDRYMEVFNYGFLWLTSSFTGCGSTDIRTTSGKWYNFVSLKTRIMVAAGAGGSECTTGGSGGDIEGIPGSKENKCSTGKYGQGNGKGAKQNGTNSSTGFFGYAANFTQQKNDNLGGNGYYGGGMSSDRAAGGGGGSSFISGHRGCDAISKSSTKDKIIHTGSPNHYSGYIFYDSIMKNGNEFFFSPTKKIVQGHIGKGVVVVTRLSSKLTCKNGKITVFNSALFIFTLIGAHN